MIFISAARHYRAVAKLGYSGTWDFWVYFPLVAALGLLVGTALVYFEKMPAGNLIALSVTAAVAVLPYLMATSGGM